MSDSATKYYLFLAAYTRESNLKSEKLPCSRWASTLSSVSDLPSSSPSSSSSSLSFYPPSLFVMQLGASVFLGRAGLNTG